MWPDLAQEKVLGGVGLEGEDESHTFMDSYSQGGFPPTLSLFFPSLSSFKRLCNVLGSSFNHRFLSFSAENHKKKQARVLWSLCEAQQHSELWGCHIVLDGRAPKLNLYVAINLEWQTE